MRIGLNALNFDPRPSDGGGSKPEGQLDPQPTSTTIPTALAAAPNILTNDDINFIRFLLCGFDKNIGGGPRSELKNSGVTNELLADFAAMCVSDTNFATIAQATFQKMTEKVQRNYKAGSTAFKYAEDFIAPFKIFTSDALDAVTEVTCLNVGYLSSLEGGPRFTEILMGRAPKPVIPSILEATTNMLIKVCEDYPDFGLALKDKIRKYLLNFQPRREAFAIWQAQLPPAARS